MSKKLFGSDPEYFVVDELGVCVPPVILRRKGMKTFGVIENQVGKVSHILYTSKDIKVIEDGASFELNISPSEGPEEMWLKLKQGQEIIANLVAPYGYKLVFVPVVPFDNNIVIINGEADPELIDACRFGCDPDFDIYSGRFSPTVDASNVPYRFGGGHLHMSPLSHVEQDVRIAGQLMDIVIGTTAVTISPYHEDELKRQEFYGRPGRLRMQVYPGMTGIEYRTPSMSWTTFGEGVNAMIAAARKVHSILESGRANEVIEDALDISLEAILSHNVEQAQLVLNYLD